jgi:hypothetical protein
MKRLAILCAVALIVLLPVVSIVGCQSTSAPPPITPTLPETKTYTEHGVSFDYPEDWVKVGAEDPGALWIVAFQENGSGIEPGVAVVAYDMEGMTLREFEEAHPWVFTNFDYTMPITDTAINGQDAIRYSWTAECEGSPVTGEHVYVTKDYEVLYFVECYSLTSEYPTKEDAFKNLFNSFEIE